MAAASGSASTSGSLSANVTCSPAITIPGSGNPVVIRVSARVRAVKRTHCSFSIQVIGSSNTRTMQEGLSASIDYSIKIMNPKKKSDFVVSRLTAKEKYKDFEGLKKAILTELKGQVEDPIRQLGYIEPGHGLRGKQRWLSTNKDMNGMYQLHQRRKELLLWTYAVSVASAGVGKKRPRSDEDSDERPKKSSRYEGLIDKMAEVDEIYEVM